MILPQSCGGICACKKSIQQTAGDRYLLDPEVVDCITFCTKNPEPMLSGLENIRKFRQFWSVTITPYGKDIEPFVPEPCEVMESFCRLSEKVGRECISWRYDPIFLSEKYNRDFHIGKHFPKWQEKLSGIQTAVSSVLST